LLIKYKLILLKKIVMIRKSIKKHLAQHRFCATADLVQTTKFSAFLEAKCLTETSYWFAPQLHKAVRRWRTGYYKKYEKPELWNVRKSPNSETSEKVRTLKRPKSPNSKTSESPNWNVRKDRTEKSEPKRPKSRTETSEKVRSETSEKSEQQNIV
jgi:hypothetical protein